MKKKRREKRQKKEGKFETKSFNQQLLEYQQQQQEKEKQRKIKDLIEDIRIFQLFQMDTTQKRQELDQLLKQK